MSDQPTDQGPAMSEKKAGKQPAQEATTSTHQAQETTTTPTHQAQETTALSAIQQAQETTAASSQQAQETTAPSAIQQAAHSSGQAAPHAEDQQTRGPAFPLINPNENLEAQFGRTYDMMIDFWRNGNPEEAEKLAYILLSWGNLPVLYRAYSHIVLAHGLDDCLIHAKKAVEEAEWGLNKYGDDGGAGSKLLAITKQVLAETEEAEAHRVGDDDEEEMEVEGEQQAQGQQEVQGPPGEQSQEKHTVGQHETGDDGEEMLLDQPYSGLVDTTATTSLPQTDIPQGDMPQADMPLASFTSGVSRTTSGATEVTRQTSSTTAPSRTTSGNTTIPSRTTSSYTTVPGETTSGATGGEVEPKKREKRDRSSSSNDEDKPPKKKVEIDQTRPSSDE